MRRKCPLILLIFLLALACGPLDSGGIRLATTPTPVGQPTKPNSDKGRCGDDICDEREQKNPALCPQDCAPTPDSLTLPLYVTIYYHVEPNPQLFGSVEPGYFEAVSLSIRGMSSDLASIDAYATFCFAWLYNDLTYCRNHDESGKVVNNPLDTGIETFEQVVADGHEVAYHSHPAMAISEGDAVYYARPNADCDAYSERHRWSSPGGKKEERMDFFPGVHQFDDPAAP